MKILPATERMEDALYTRAFRHLSVEPGTTLDDLMRPGFWRHVVTKLKELDIVEVVSADRTLDVLLRVVRIEPGLCYMRPLLIAAAGKEAAPDVVDDSEEAPAVPDGYKIDHTPRTRWRVRTIDPVVEVSRNHLSKADAVASAMKHAAKAMGEAA